MKTDKTASVKMKWNSFTFPIKVGTPVSKDGVLSNNEDAFGLVIRTVEKKPDAGELLQVMTGGIIDMEEVIAGYGTELSNDAMTAMSGIHVYSDGKRINVSEESEEILEEINRLFSGILKVKAYSFNYTAPANGAYNTAFEPSEEGYVPVGIVRFNTNSLNVIPGALQFGSGAYTIFARNVSSESVTATLGITVLFAKTNAVT